jgi:hypothetical protein
MAPPFLTSARNGGEWSASRAALLRGKSPLYPLDRRLDGPQNLSGHCEVEKIYIYYPFQELNAGGPARRYND